MADIDSLLDQLSSTPTGYATPEQIKQLRTMSDILSQPINRKGPYTWATGLDDFTRSIVGALDYRRANELEQRNLQSVAIPGADDTSAGGGYGGGYGGNSPSPAANSYSGDASGNPSTPLSNVSAYDRDAMIRTVIGEAGNENAQSQAGVAHVIKNRVATGFASTPADVVFQHGQFEPWATRGRELNSIDPNSPQYKRAATVVDGVLSGQIPDITRGATHFYAPQQQAQLGRPAPAWASQFIPTAAIGGHQYFIDPARARAQAAQSQGAQPGAMPQQAGGGGGLGPVGGPQDQPTLVRSQTFSPSGAQTGGPGMPTPGTQPGMPQPVAAPGGAPGFQSPGPVLAQPPSRPAGAPGFQAPGPLLQTGAQPGMPPQAGGPRMPQPGQPAQGGIVIALSAQLPPMLDANYIQSLVRSPIPEVRQQGWTLSQERAKALLPQQMKTPDGKVLVGTIYTGFRDSGLPAQPSVEKFNYEVGGVKGEQPALPQYGPNGEFQYRTIPLVGPGGQPSASGQPSTNAGANADEFPSNGSIADKASWAERHANILAAQKTAGDKAGAIQSTLDEDAKNAIFVKRNLSELRNLAQGINPNKGAEAKEIAGNVLQSFGFSNKAVSDFLGANPGDLEAFRKAQTTLGAELTHSYFPRPAQSEFRILLQNATPNSLLTPQGLGRIIDFAEKGANQSLDAQQDFVNFKRSHGAHEWQNWEADWNKRQRADIESGKLNSVPTTVGGPASERQRVRTYNQATGRLE